ncbi:MAG TPA: hypothetical protein VFH56_05715 [Acidimicrobiales bacterium]|nr:hypothetical protein [Acidimicrobiales bacterium]
MSAAPTLPFPTSTPPAAAAVHVLAGAFPLCIGRWVAACTCRRYVASAGDQAAAVEAVRDHALAELRRQLDPTGQEPRP